MSAQEELFEPGRRLPEGFVYQPEFLSPTEEAGLLAVIERLPLEHSRYRQFVARRRTVSYGYQYDFAEHSLDPAPAIPDFLLPLREKVAGWTGLPAAQFTHGLVAEYSPGAPLGWHRDVPDFEAVVGVSLRGTARMRLRPYRPGQRHRREDVIALELQPRSAYQLRDNARWGWQHCIAPTKELRYSITFRTARSPSAARR
jgi:alkylated DNA repair dioxygenase AlkB